MTHTLVKACTCQECEKARFEVRALTIIAVALVVLAVTGWLVLI